ncbi:serine hydrolase domain-containing protein [Micromonospora chersina]|uniref:serine hydrolase domain-containing protein n=1 Tax=Micromonospora chersina TaxID=47854 RepID=UPI0033EAFF80
MHRRDLLGVLAGVTITAPLAGVALAPASAGAATKPPAGRFGELQRLLDAEHDAGMPGAFAQVRESGRTYPLATGLADVRTHRRARPWFQHRVGGVTKSFVAVAILQLVGEGHIDLDKPIRAYLPNLLPEERGRRTTVRMLLNQTSGLDDYTKVLFATHESIAATARCTFRPQELVDTALTLPPIGEPGARWSYANTNYVILGMLIRKVCGRSYATEVTRRVLKPLKLDDTYFPGRETTIRGPHLRAYIPWSDGSPRDFTRYDMSWAAAAGDMISTASDVNRFYRALLGGRILPPSLLREMKTTVPFDPSIPDVGGYGLGLYWILGPCGRDWGHNGLVIGHTTYSTHSEDGCRSQLTLAENYNYYAPANQQPPHPIDVARNAFQSAVVSNCGPAVAGAPAARRLDLAMPPGSGLLAHPRG